MENIIKNDSVRVIKAKADIYDEASALIHQFSESDKIKSIDIERIGENGKFFGFGLTHKLKLKLIDTKKEINLSTKNNIKIGLRAETPEDGKNYLPLPENYTLTGQERLHVSVPPGKYEFSWTSYETTGTEVPLLIFFTETGKEIYVYLDERKNPSHKVNIDIDETIRKMNIYSQEGAVSSKGVTTIFKGLKIVSRISYVDYPFFYISEVNRDENTNELSITAYDKLNFAQKISLNSLKISVPYTIGAFVTQIATHLGLNFRTIGEEIPELNLNYLEGANFEGTESLFSALTAAAEATQTVFYISDKDLIFKRLASISAYKIPASEYITLESKTNRRLSEICSVTELGDNVSASLPETGTTQYVRENPFWVLRDDLPTLVDNALAAVGGRTINQFECHWRGYLPIVPGERVDIETLDGDMITSYILDDTIHYDGSLEEVSQWEYNNENEPIDSNPTTLGDIINKTFARVDKTNQRIDLVVQGTNDNSEAIAALKLNQESISASVTEVEKNTQASFDSVNKDMSNIVKTVESKMNAEEVELQIKKELQGGIDKVTTSTGFTFDEKGLTVEKSGSEMTTTITEDGMRVLRDNTEVLKADNKGVDAYNLHARTYLIVGESSRFEDYEEDGAPRTGCFWIGR